MLGIMVYAQAQDATTGAASSTGSGDCLTSKSGCKILPEAGDCAIGIDGVPVVKSVLNLFNGNAAPSWNFLNGNPNYVNTIFVKHFLSEQTAIRGKFRIGFEKSRDVFFTPDVTSTSNPPLNVMDEKGTTKSYVGLAGGLEKRRGKSRIQGFYGAEAGFALATESYSYSYGNALSPVFPNRINHFAGGQDNLLTSKHGTTFVFEARGFAGVEYFLFPKLCIGGEFGWGARFEMEGKGQNDYEEWSNAANASRKWSTEQGGRRAFILDTDNFSGAIYMLFHF